MADFCNPLEKDKKICFTKKILIELIQIWNTNNPSNIIKFTTKNTKKILFDKLDDVMIKYKKCIKGEYWKWTSILKKNSDPSKKLFINNVENNFLKPEKPKEWLKNPITWLTNYDIENVMKQYSNNKLNNYKFLGVFPIDFTLTDNNDNCIINSLCRINIKEFIKNNIKYIGFITNLDKHNEPGSHWTSTFIIIDPKLISYGSYYYDSGAKKTPDNIMTFINDIKEQCNKIYPKHNFTHNYNKIIHQRKNTECGIFSISFQLRWLNNLTLLKNKKATFDYIVNKDFIHDDNMVKLRDILFRPPSI